MSATQLPASDTLHDAVAPSAWRDYSSILKPRISLMVLITVVIGYCLAVRGEWHWGQLLAACVGVTLVATASSAMNQWYEQDTDGLMRRTRTRPLPSGRMLPWEVFSLGLVSGCIGCVILVAMVNIQTAILAAITWGLYVGVYTPLKRVTPMCTAVGAVPGAMPPVLGWAAAGAPLDLTALTLFGILFLWQFPHFLAIGWKYAEDYEAAGLKMLPDPQCRPHRTGIVATAYAVGLLLVSLLPTYLGVAGWAYAAVAVVCGLGYLAASIAFARRETLATARRLILVSLVYLPVVLGVLLWDHWRL